MKVAILTIGDEVVIGKTVNTNASYLARELESNNFIVSGHIAVRDTIEAINNALEYLYRDSSIVITTGGLGPTVDDITKEACAIYFNKKLIMFNEELEKIKGYFNRQNVIMPEINVRQACFISDSIVINNDNGTAPGMIYENNNQIVINLPGPPKELEPMLCNTVIPYLKEKNKVMVYDKKYRLMNIGESHAETIIKPLYEKYLNIKIAPYASVGVIDYMISTNNKEEIENLNNCCKEFEEYLKDYIIGDWSKSINELIVEILSNKNLKLAIAESCTGGMVSSSIVDVKGSSCVLLEGLVTYSNEAKHNRLGVKTSTLHEYGAVSEEAAKEMAKGVALNSGADIGISTTGIAGPSGGSLDKPVGLVYTAIYYNNEIIVFKHNFNGDRYKIRQRTTMSLLYALFRLIKTL